MALFGLIPSPQVIEVKVPTEADRAAYQAKVEAEGTVPYTFSDGTTANIPPSTAAQLDANAKIAEDIKIKYPELAKGPPPVKIDTVTGKGVPGGFTGASSLKPTAAISQVQSMIAAIASAAGSLTAAASAMKSGAISAVPGVASAQGKLNGLKTKSLNKIKALSKAPDLSSKFKLPAPPKIPEKPNLSALKLPTVPEIPKLPSVPSVPSMPSIAASLPSVPKIPTLG